MSMPAELVIRGERARQGEELRLMAQEEQRCRAVAAFERRRAVLERGAMAASEHYGLQLRDVEALGEQEEVHVARALKIIAGDCRHLFAHKEEDEEMIVA